MRDQLAKGELGRFVGAAAALVVTLGTFVVLVGAGSAGTLAPALAQYGKVTICHKGKTITVSARAWPAHQRHGDTLGACPAPTAGPTVAGTTTKPGKRKGSGKHAPNPGSATRSTGTSGGTSTESSTTPTAPTGGQGNGNGHGKGHG